MRTSNIHLADQFMSVAATGAATWYMLSMPFLEIAFTNPAGGQTLTLVNDPEFAVLDLGSLVVVTAIQDAVVGGNLITWPVDFVFSTPGDMVPSPAPSAITKWTGI